MSVFGGISLALLFLIGNIMKYTEQPNGNFLGTERPNYRNVNLHLPREISALAIHSYYGMLGIYLVYFMLNKKHKQLNPTTSELIYKNAGNVLYIERDEWM